MKKIFVFVLAMVGILTSEAQKKDPIAGKREFREKMVAEKLKLSEEQKQKAKKLNEDYRKELSELRKKDDLVVKEWRSRMMELNKKHREDMRGLLTNQQKERSEERRVG